MNLRPALLASRQARVRELRRVLGISQSAFADLIGVTMMTVHRWENSKALPSPLAWAIIKRLEAKRKLPS